MTVCSCVICMASCDIHMSSSCVTTSKCFQSKAALPLRDHPAFNAEPRLLQRERGRRGKLLDNRHVHDLILQPEAMEDQAKLFSPKAALLSQPNETLSSLKQRKFSHLIKPWRDPPTGRSTSIKPSPSPSGPGTIGQCIQISHSPTHVL